MTLNELISAACELRDKHAGIENVEVKILFENELFDDEVLPIERLTVSADRSLIFIEPEPQW